MTSLVCFLLIVAKFLESKPFERKYYLGDVIGPIKLNFPIYGYKWTFFAGVSV